MQTNAIQLGLTLISNWLADVPSWEWWTIGTALHMLTFLLVTTHCLQMRREPTSILLWMFVSWSFPVVGPLLYLSFGVYRVPAKGWRKHQRNLELLALRREREEEGLPLAYWRAVHESLAAEPKSEMCREINRAMTAILPDYPLLGGNDVRLLVGGPEAYPAMLDAIRQARHHIHFQTFMICNDHTGQRFLDALAEKARQGVTVRFLYDRFGSTYAVWGGLFRRYRGIPNLHICGWTLANPLKRQFQINLRNHRKIMVVDGRRAFTGGINIHDAHVDTPGASAIRDYHFDVRGPIVQELQYSFLRDWYFMTDEDPDRLLTEEHFPQINPSGDALIRLVNSGPASEFEAIADVFFTCVTLARRQILAVTPYFVPTPELVRGFRIAALRGVDVRLVLPKKNNHVYAGLAGRAFYEELMEAGVRIYERTPPFIHAKALVVDDRMALVGTANMDVRSLRLNFEVNLAIFEHEAFINDMKRAFWAEVAESQELDLAVWRTRPLREKILENFCYLMTPIL